MAAVVVGFVILLRNIDINRLQAVLLHAAWLPLGGAALASFGILMSKSWAWQRLLAPTHRAQVTTVTRITLLSYAASIIVPFRGGEVLRVLLLDRDCKVPPLHAATIAAAEKLLDVVAILLLAAPLPWLLPQLPASTGWWLALGGCAALGGLTLLVRWTMRRCAALAPRTLMVALVILLAGWLLDCVAIALVMVAVGIHISLAAILLALLGINFASAIPSTPSQMGALQLGAAAALQWIGVAIPDAIAFATLYQLVQIGPLLLVGFVLDYRIMLGRWPLPQKRDPQAT